MTHLQKYTRTIHKRLYEIIDPYCIDHNKAISLMEYKIIQYANRDLNNNKHLNFKYKKEQRERYLNLINYTLKRKYGEPLVL
jgi:ABC-type transporter MlaC component